jgi:hypothetical protein
MHAIDAEESHTTIVGRFSPRSRIAADDPIELVVDTGALHFFDAESGLGIYSAQREGALT